MTWQRWAVMGVGGVVLIIGLFDSMAWYQWVCVLSGVVLIAASVAPDS